MNLILLFADDFIAADKVCLRGRRLQHVREIHRAASGDTLSVGLCNGQIGRGLVLSCEPEQLQLQVVLDHEPPPPLPTTLLLALPRPKVLKRVLISAVSMGVKQIILLNAYRVEKSYWQSPLLSPDKLDLPLHLGLEQARDTLLPTISQRQRFKPFVEDELPQLCAGKTALVAHPLPAGSASALPAHPPQLLAIGPEGGFTAYEIDKMQQAGCRPFSLGPRALRVEAAVPALLARLCPGG